MAKTKHPRKLSHLQTLREQSRELSNIGLIWGDNTLEGLLEEIMKALAPLRYLKEASIDHQEHLDHFMVNGYLSLFLAHMDHILANAEFMAKSNEPKGHKAA